MEQEDLKLIKKYLNGEATPSEAAYARDLLSQHLVEDDDLTRQLLFEEWEKTISENKSGIDINDAWDEFIQIVNRRVPKKEKPVRTIWRQIMVAASVAAILVSATLYFKFFNHTEQLVVVAKEATYILKSTGQGEKLNISFPDGSFIRLNSSTRLEIPSNYNSERSVYLEGEAYFEINKIDDKPFKVITGEVITEVLGTAFNVNTFGSNNEVSVAVVEGKVRVYNNNNIIELNPEEMTTVGPSTQNFTKNRFNLELVAGWRNNILVFDKVTFAEMVEKLKQWYGVEFVIEGNSPKGLYSGRFENKSLQLVLEGLGFSSEFDYKIVDKDVFLKFN